MIFLATADMMFLSIGVLPNHPNQPISTIYSSKHNFFGGSLRLEKPPTQIDRYTAQPLKFEGQWSPGTCTATPLVVVVVVGGSGKDVIVAVALFDCRGGVAVATVFVVVPGF